MKNTFKQYLNEANEYPKVNGWNAFINEPYDKNTGFEISFNNGTYLSRNRLHPHTTDRDKSKYFDKHITVKNQIKKLIADGVKENSIRINIIK